MWGMREGVGGRVGTEASSGIALLAARGIVVSFDRSTCACMKAFSL